MNDNIDIAAMLAAYIECMLWSSTTDTGEPLDRDYFPTDVAEESQREAREDCIDFVRQATEAGITLTQSPVQLGHDLWLTRCRHGAGFWDRGLGAVGKQLTAIANGMGSRDAYVGDDGKVYIQ